MGPTQEAAEPIWETKQGDQDFLFYQQNATISPLGKHLCPNTGNQILGH